MEGPARTGHDPGGGLRLEWPVFRQPVPDRQGDDGDQLERPSLLRASAGKIRRCGPRKGPPKGRGTAHGASLGNEDFGVSVFCAPEGFEFRLTGKSWFALIAFAVDDG